MELSVDKWVVQLEDIVTFVFQNSKLPPSRNRVYSTCLCVTASITCSPCIIWSTIWRVLACPFQCISHGMTHICSGNGCTQLTDDCITIQCNLIYTKKVLPNLPKKESLTADECKLLKSKLQWFLDIYNSNKTNKMFFTNAHYIIHDCVCPSLKRFINTEEKTTPHNLVKILEDVISTLPV